MDELIELSGVLLQAILNGEWWAAAAVVVAILMLGLRLGPWEILKTVPVQVLGSFLLAALGGVINVLTAGGAFSLEVLVAVIKIGAAAGAAAGGIPALVAWWKARKAAETTIQ